MIGTGKFSAQIASIKDVLCQLQLFGSREMHPNRKLTAYDFRGLNYFDVYKKHIELSAYDFILTDQSLLYFTFAGTKFEKGGMSFSYIESPVDALTYEAFVCSILEIDFDSNDYSEKIEEAGDLFLREYEDYVAGLPFKAGSCPVRFDCSAAQYRPNVHPACHLHIGFGNEMRLATRRIISPMGFVLFIIRQRYPKEWEKLAIPKLDKHLQKEIRSGLNQVPNHCWLQDDERELYLS